METVWNERTMCGSGATPVICLARLRRENSRPVARAVASAAGRILAGEVVSRLTGDSDTVLEEAQGRPVLRWVDPSRTEDPPCLSLSYCDNWVGIAVAPRGRIGLDIEPSASVSERVARRVMGTIDTAQFDRLPEGERPAAGTRYWTRAEALAKADGGGLTLMLSRTVSAGFCGTGSWRSLRVMASELPVGLTCALACEGDGGRADATMNPTIASIW